MPEVIFNCGHWLLPLTPTRAKIGATYAAGEDHVHPTAKARAELERSAGRWKLASLKVVGHEAGLRVTLPDKRPVAGRSPLDPGLGLVGGLGSKGVLHGPWLARQWWNYLSEGVPFDPMVDVARFWRNGAAGDGAIGVKLPLF